MFFMDERLHVAVNQELRAGWQVVSQTPTAVRLQKGHPTSHLLHLVLSVLTMGLWIPVWIFMAVVAGEKNKTLYLDKNGNVRTNRWA